MPTRRTLWSFAAVLSLLIASLAVRATPARGADAPASGKVYELRVYKANPGKLDALHARFRDHTCALFKKHGIEVLGYWTPTEGDEAKDTLIYLVVFPSVEAQKQAWQAFQNDPEWKKVKAESEKDGPILKEKGIESKNLKPTDYSLLR